ncbi:hypothetical protein JCM3766R1_005881 [Sporobolomyces carnicolor]
MSSDVPRDRSTSSSSSPVRLSTFSYTPLDPRRSSSDLERGASTRSPTRATHDRTGGDADEEDDDGGGGVEEELIWHPNDERRVDRERITIMRAYWSRQAALFIVGAIVGACVLSVTNRTLNLDTSRPTTTTTTTTTSPTGSSRETYDFVAHPPVRIHYREEPELNSRSPLLATSSNCPVSVVYTKDEDSADIVVFNSDSHKGLDDDEMRAWRDAKPWQKLAIWGVESAPNREVLERHFDKLRNGKRNETYDYDMTYRLNSTVPATYSYSYFNYANPPVPYEAKRHDKIAASFVTNCRPKNARTRVLDELTRLLPGQVDNFGQCHNNANADETLKQMGHYDDVGSHNKWNTKITMINYYLFSVAFENSNDYDYVTEKYFQALERGSVPLVFGAPSYRDRFFPAPNAAIDLAEYLPANYTVPSRHDDEQPEDLSDEAKAGLARLAERLKFLASERGRAEYESMLEWKRTGEWRRNDDNPLGKIVRLATSEFEQDCKLAKIFRDGARQIDNIPGN